MRTCGDRKCVHKFADSEKIAPSLQPFRPRGKGGRDKPTRKAEERLGRRPRQHRIRIPAGRKVINFRHRRGHGALVASCFLGIKSTVEEGPGNETGGKEKGVGC
eukprot:1045734-Amorphochlora_amoeboformis.AAC.1